MNTFDKVQREIAPERLRSRQHAVPADVRLYAGEQQLKFEGKRGRGRQNVPALADIYHQLAVEGLDLVLNNDWRVGLAFTEIGQPENCAMTKIKFDVDFDQKLRDLKTRIDSGEFNVVPADADARKVTKISLISLAINLMQLAIGFRKGELNIIKLKPKSKSKKV